MKTYYKIGIKPQKSAIGRTKRIRLIRESMTPFQKAKYGKSYPTRLGAQRHLNHIFRNFDLITQLEICEFSVIDMNTGKVL